MTFPRAPIWVAALALIVAMGAGACGSDSDPSADPEGTATAAPTESVTVEAAASPTESATAEPTSTPTATASPTEPPTPDPTPTETPPGLIEVEYSGGSVVGGAGRTRVPAGTAVELRVTADVSDEVHVHGYDIFGAIVPGVPAVLEFDANIPGVWEVELEGAGALLVELEVN